MNTQTDFEGTPSIDTAHQGRILFTLFIATVAVRVVFHWLTGFMWDDAFITFRYAENIAAGYGFVYNIGERVLGTTTPLFTLILAALKVVGLPLVESSLVIGLFCSGLAAIMVYRIGLQWNLGVYAVPATAIYILFPRLMANDTGGMETPVFVCLVAVAFYYRNNRQWSWAYLAASLATLTRPEGLLLLGLLVVADVRRHPKPVIRGVVMAMALIIPWVLFAWSYFGSPIPSSIYGKLAYYAAMAGPPFVKRFRFLLGLHHPLGIVLAVMALVGALRLVLYRQVGRLELLWCSCLLLGYTFTHTYLFLWYPSPVYPFYALSGIAAVQGILNLGYLRSRWVTWRHLAVSAGIVLSMAIAHVWTVRGYRAFQSNYDLTLVAIGHFLQRNARADDVIAAEDIGYLGYIGGLHILDRDGLVTPLAHHFNRRGDYYGFIEDTNPDWVVATRSGSMSDFTLDDEFLKNYRRVETFGAPPGAIYHLYARMHKGN